MKDTAYRIDNNKTLKRTVKNKDAPLNQPVSITTEETPAMAEECRPCWTPEKCPKAPTLYS